MERYSEYKDSGVKWLGEIPSHWEVMPIKYISEVSSGATPKTSVQGYWDGNITWVTPADFKTETKFVLKGNRNITTLGVKSCSTVILPKGSLVFSKRAPIGQVSILKIPLCTNQGCFGIIPNESMNNSFLYYSLAIHAQSFNTLGSGTTFRELSFSTFSSFKLSVPPKEEQDAIVRYLDAATSKIDKAIAMQQKMIDLLNERKQIIIQNAVTKGLDENVEMKDSGVEWTEFFPNSWSIKKVKYIFEFISTKEVASNRTFNIALENIVAHSGNYIDTNSEYEAAGVSFRKNDILFGKLRPYLAKVHLCERAGIALGDIFVLRPLSGFDSSFLRYLLISERFIQYVDSSTYGAKMPRANWNFIGNIYVAYPTLDKQRDISKYLDKEMQRFDSAISNCQRQISLLQERKQIIINEVVTGKVKVS